MGQQLTFNFMLKFFLLILLGVSYPCSTHQSTSPSNTHAILIAGTSGWLNYRHQANIAHAYQILRSHGVPEENIIVMSADDVVHSDENPMKGKLFNSPNGFDVYSGLKIDYSSDQVTLSNFFNILKGSPEPESSSKVLQSSANDSVFIYISSYGSTGLISFPNEILTSAIFNQALISMKNNQKFSQLIVYLDTDYSGSMFDSILSENITVYGVSSASTNQINVACYCNNSLIPFTCLSSSFSIAWLADSGSQRTLKNESLTQQFEVIVESLAHHSSPLTQLTPVQYGDLSLGNLPIGKFMGSSESVKIESSTSITDQLSTFDVPLEMIKAKVTLTHNEEPLMKLKNSRRSFDQAFYRLINDLCWAGYCSNATKILTDSHRLTNHSIYSSIVTKFHSNCLNIARGSYAMSKMYAFANIINESEAKLSQQLDKFLPTLYQACRRRIITHGYENII